jgi:hypothetical protein
VAARNPGELHAARAGPGREPGLYPGVAQALHDAGHERVVQPADQRGLAYGEDVERAVVQQEVVVRVLPRLESEEIERADQVAAVLR